jgi:hypothetical protein
MFILFTIFSKGGNKDIATNVSSTQYPFIQQKYIKNIVEVHKYILTTPTGVPPHNRVKKSYNISIHTLLVATSSTNYSHTEEDHAVILVEWI